MGMSTIVVACNTNNTDRMPVQMLLKFIQFVLVLFDFEIILFELLIFFEFVLKFFLFMHCGGN